MCVCIIVDPQVCVDGWKLHVCVQYYVLTH